MGGIPRCRGGLAVAALAAAGCGGGPDGYDPTLSYPLRTDPIVVRLPSIPPTRPADPGKLDESLYRFGSLGGAVIEPAKLPDPQKLALRETLTRLFGTPAAPRLPDEVAATDSLLTPVGLANGSRLYRRHCAHCHGLTGDGRGPTGLWLYPHPRDFRQGLFKAAGVNGKPHPTSLARVIRTGVPGTSMPALDLIPDADVSAIAGYVVHLSLRGETEVRATVAAEGEDGSGDVAADAADAAGRAWKQWEAAANPPVPSDMTADGESVRRGSELFTAAGCVACHVDYGRTEQYRYDVWGGTGRVTDLTRGEYRWGREPADLARRVRCGIPGTAMPANPGLTDDQVRDVVAFLQALPAPPRLPADVRDKVYPGPPQDTAISR